MMSLFLYEFPPTKQRLDQGCWADGTDPATQDVIIELPDYSNPTVECRTPNLPLSEPYRVIHQVGVRD